MRLAKTFTIEPDINDYVDETKGDRSASERVNEGRAVEALRLLDVVLVGEPSNRSALEAKLSALESLVAACRNTNERGWLDASITETRRKLE